MDVYARAPFHSLSLLLPLKKQKNEQECSESVFALACKRETIVLRRLHGLSPRHKLETVHVVSMTHMDIGWTDLAGSVCRWYFDSWFPAALQTIEDLRARGGRDQFIVQTHPWILQELLYGSAGCTSSRPAQSTIDRVRAEMRRGTIAWQAKPFNMLVELAPVQLLNWSFGISPSSKQIASLSVRRALLTSQANPGSRYRYMAGALLT